MNAKERDHKDGELPCLLARGERKITKKEINDLPLVKCELPIWVVSSQSELVAALPRIGREGILGFDTETKPSFRKGVVHPTALLQLATASGVFVIQLAKLDDYSGLAEILSDPARVKAGVAVSHDVNCLRQRFAFDPSGFVDLGMIAEKNGLSHHGLRGLAACLMGVRISKKAQLSDWSANQLSASQIDYSATDAWISRELYLVMFGVTGRRR